jgi:hypothetical protein
MARPRYGRPPPGGAQNAKRRPCRGDARETQKTISKTEYISPPICSQGLRPLGEIAAGIVRRLVEVRA